MGFFFQIFVAFSEYLNFSILCTHIVMPSRNCIYSISFTEETDLVSINSSCGCSGGGGDGKAGGGSAGGGSRSPSPKLKPNRTSLDLHPTWIRRSFEQLHSVLSPQSTIYGSAAGGSGGGGGGGGAGIKNPNISQSTGNLASDTSSGNVCETNSGSSAHGTTKEQNEQQSETLPAYNSESG
jgi:hypothetical protein